MTVSARAPVTEIPEVHVTKQHTDEALAAQVIQAIELAGVCIVRNIFSQEIVHQILDDLEPHVPQTDSFIGRPSS